MPNPAATDLPTFCRLCREISFQFRTRLPHGLLVYHNVKNPEGITLDPYALYVIVEKGQLKVVHVFGKHATSVTVGKGLNRDEWHSVMVKQFKNTYETHSHIFHTRNAKCHHWALYKFTKAINRFAHDSFLHMTTKLKLCDLR